MKAIILAAGFSTRLYPLTKNFPKGLLPVNNKAITGYVLEDVLQLPEVDEIVLVTNHRYFPLFNLWLKTYYLDKKIKLFDNHVDTPETRLGAIGDLQFVLNETKWNDDLLVLSSDTLTSLKLSEFVDFFQKNHGFVNSIYDIKDPSIIAKKLGCAIVEGEKLIQFVEKPEVPPSTLTSIPFYVYPKESIPLINQYLAQNGHPDAPGSIIPWLIGKIPTYAFNIGNGYYYDVGTIEVYNHLTETFKK